ncbi:ZINC FINGER CCCH DOMAIN-CONTAINING PROTEIN 58 [Salix purpurea]|uniref:ZINC FINGER CCCH DOMAIN-CONTAINING PROTEIN 58 n=1 Tax=Salix purpurea TaxID=77065 RepID=A0A9Q0Z398_SALPP|nr:ZINC FINGER CCCH DOMAIN-CONTAINING PROTEIN 58 [Salix purpurea]
MDRYGRAQEGSQSDPAIEWTGSGQESGLEEGFWQLGLGETESEYPERPNEQDCPYYLRTGLCGYGASCRYNHPRDRTVVLRTVRTSGVEFPERVGQPLCQYYMRTGTCKFGASCKYNHPKQGGSSISPVSLNYYGYPLRLGERECTYYIKTGQCKFGATCKFHHPQPGSYVQGPFGHVLLSPSLVPYPSWSPYPAPVSPVASPNTQPAVGSGSVYGISPLSPSAPAYTGAYQSIPTAKGPSSSSQKEHLFPERPGQPDCQYYMKTGDCKFRSSCKYHHPPELVASKTNVVLSPMGLPLRPSKIIYICSFFPLFDLEYSIYKGVPACTHYTQRGQCKFGPACKFDHPMGTLSYSPSASSLADMPVAPYPVGSSIGTLAPSSSSSDLRSKPSKDSSSTSQVTVPVLQPAPVPAPAPAQGHAPHAKKTYQTVPVHSSF